MDIIAGMPFFKLEITKDGQVFSAPQKTAIENAVRDSGAGKLTDLFAISHGWNNDNAEARELYNELFANLAALMPDHAILANRKFAVVGIFWPSKKFADSELIPSGGSRARALSSLRNLRKCGHGWEFFTRTIASDISTPEFTYRLRRRNRNELRTTQRAHPRPHRPPRGTSSGRRAEKGC